MMAAPEFDVLETEVANGKVEEVEVEPHIKVTWSEDDEDDVQFIKDSIEQQIRSQYAQAFAIEEQLAAKVRVPLPPSVGAGWMTNEDGSYVEHWEDVSIKDLESFILAASSEAFFASQKVIDDYAEAVIAKLLYDDDYDRAYASLLTGTINDKQAKAKRKTQTQRWLALYKSLYYKRSSEVVSKLESHVRRVEKIYQEMVKESERSFRAARS